jgi:hypothetical protein
MTKVRAKVRRTMMASDRIGPRAHSRRSGWHQVTATASIAAVIAGALGCGNGSSGDHKSAWKTLRPLAGLGGESLGPGEGVVLAKIPFSGGGTVTIRGKKPLQQKPRTALLLGFKVNGSRGEPGQGGSSGFPVGNGRVAASLASEQSCVNGVDVVLVYGLVSRRQYEVHAFRDGIQRTFRKAMLPANWGVSGALVVATLSEAPWRVVVTTPHGEVVMRTQVPTQVLSRHCST